MYLYIIYLLGIVIHASDFNSKVLVFKMYFKFNKVDIGNYNHNLLFYNVKGSYDIIPVKLLENKIYEYN